ncbi:MAG: hypothetical protein U5L96_08085 [Owenweeksia sp.]|nr:hypothetical protein [Owenweeksia sp.]
MKFSTDLKAITMKMLKTYLLTAVLLSTTCLMAQDTGDDVHDISIGVPSVAIMDLEAASGTTINLGPATPVEAGEATEFHFPNSRGHLVKLLFY